MRLRPVLLTAGGVIIGASVILADPIFQGLGLSLIAGGVASTFLSWPAVPVLYYMLNARSAQPISFRFSEAAGGCIMTVERAVRLLAGIIVLASLALAHWVSP